MIRFRVNGTPAPQGSKRHVGNGRMVEMSKAVGPWREAVRADAVKVRQRDPAWTGDYIDKNCPLWVSLTFVVSRPKGHYGTGRNRATVKPSAPPYPAGRPDVDKLARAVLDGLTMGGVMADDAQVVELIARKRYASNGEAPGAVIEVEAL